MVCINCLYFLTQFILLQVFCPFFEVFQETYYSLMGNILKKSFLGIQILLEQIFAFHRVRIREEEDFFVSSSFMKGKKSSTFSYLCIILLGRKNALMSQVANNKTSDNLKNASSRPLRAVR